MGEKAGLLEPNSSIEDRISARYGALSDKLQAAADYVIQSPIDVATRSLRSIATSSGLAPSTFSRLARALDFDSYEELRELSRDAVGRRAVTFSDKARRLSEEAANSPVVGGHLFHRQAAASVQNIEDMVHAIDLEKLDGVVDTLARARCVRLLGALSSRGIVDYMNYLANWANDNWVLVDLDGAGLATALEDAGEDDAFVLISKPLFGNTVVRTAKLAAEKGAYVLVITDTHTCPALEFASAHFILPTDSPHFFSSYVSTLVLVETILSMLVAKSGPKAETRIKEIEANNKRLGQYWAD